MSTVKVLLLGGLDKKSNDLTRSAEKASDMINMEHDTQSTLKKRNGFASVLIDGSSSLPAGVLKDMIFFSARDEIILFMYNTPSVYVWALTRAGAAWTSRIIDGPLSYEADKFPVSHCENQGCLYYTYQNGLAPVAKYDGASSYISGLKTPYASYDSSNKIITDYAKAVAVVIFLLAPFTSATIGIESVGPGGSIEVGDLVYKSDGVTLIGAVTVVTYTSSSLAITFASAHVFNSSELLYIAASSGFNTNAVFNNVPDQSFAPGRAYYARLIPKFTDYYGNVTFGPYIQSSLTYSGQGIQVKASNFSNLNSYKKYMAVTTVGAYVLNSTTRTVPVTSGDHNYVAGDKFLLIANSQFITVNAPLNKTSFQLVVESVTATSVTFTAASLSGVSITLTAGKFIIFDRSCEYIAAISLSPETGYYIATTIISGIDFGPMTAFPRPDIVYQGFTFSDHGFAANSLVALLDVYDTTTLKIKPPICRYLSSFGNQIIYGYIFSVYTLENQLITYNAKSLLMYSDTSAGDGPENISTLNRQKIGETYDGDITGIVRCNDSLIIGKTRGVYTIDGYISQGQYQLRKLNTNSVGVSSFKSLVNADDGVLFQGHNGIYFSNGVDVQRITFEIDYLFLSATYASTRAVILKKKQKSLFYVPELSKVVVIDYYYNQIYLWSGIDASLGLIEDIDGNVYFSNGSGLFLFNDSYTDNGSAITASYSTNWHHNGEPSLNKKWLSLRAWGLSTDAFTLNVKTEGDWKAGTTLTNNDIVFAADTQTTFLMFDMQTKKALRIIFSNSVNNENMVITGYELTYELFSMVDKN